MIARRAIESDRDAVLALYRELRPHDPPLAPDRAAALWSSVHDSPHSLIAVCEHEGQVAATCMLALVANLASEGRPIGFIEHVVTASAARRLGLGEACLAFATDEAWRLGCCKVVLLSGAQRPQAHRLYEKLGFNGDVERGFVIKRPVG
ncbi:GNAT superfamily N-acetyltransferase [Acidovorax soli]|uniref:GNAT superfamily N-acetyltransferase n=1 Tax=Acidovorax soli TaxID=592050 RepID=A0A7X0PKQ2_9BURK|nr:GNAT family N-acetyltransferase [Acidovorax soli]MBB6563723.1 GNAT superfamily N-acetyltransferase [Acidovorax soli]